MFKFYWCLLKCLMYIKGADVMFTPVLQDKVSVMQFMIMQINGYILSYCYRILLPVYILGWVFAIL